MTNILKFNEFLKESMEYEADYAVEKVLYRELGNWFLDNRNEILDNIYTTMSMRTLTWGLDEIIEDYPELESARDDLRTAFEKEGYEDYTIDDWEDVSDDGPEWDYIKND